MKNLIFLSILLLLFTSLIAAMSQNNTDNPFFKSWNTPFQTPPFNEIKVEHFLPAYEEGIKQVTASIEAIVNSGEKPTFANTVVALEKSDTFLTRVRNVFNALSDANTNDQIQGIAEKTAPMLSRLSDDIYLNPKLFDRVKQIYDSRNNLNLTPEEKTILKNYYLNFIRGGANLDEPGKQKLRKINEELSLLCLKFSNNLLKETIAIGLLIENKDDLAGLPEDVVHAAADLAKSKGLDGKWAFSLQKPSFIPFLQYSEKRDLREKVFKAYCNRGNNNNEYDNKKTLSRIAALRVERSNLLGYKTYANFALEKAMAQNPENVFKLLNDLWKPASKRAQTEADDMQKIIAKEGKQFNLAAWDWSYYAEKVKKEKYALDEEMLRPYFKMENVRRGVFDVAAKLYGIQIVERNDIQVYHPDVKAFEVKEADGRHIGIFYADYYPRDGKRNGAWSSSFRDHSNIGGNKITPVVYNVGNFAKPTAEKPSLMSVDDVKTLFHEFGHALHSLFSNTVYPSGQVVPQDFVELPSQIMENWAMDPDVLGMYAKHYKTGEPMPQELIEKIAKSSLFNQGFETVEYLAASFLDMDWHTISDTMERNVPDFEQASLSHIGLFPQIASRYQSTNFAHIFSGSDYSAGYYSYIWAAVLDADAFEAFKEKNDVFDKATATAFRKEVLEKGGSEDVMLEYKRFRGAEPKIDALLKRRGLK
jgi:peptidyl-dipeptidase Dcp